MTAANRQNDMIDILKKADGPVSGQSLSSAFNVSRQIIVKDINSLRSKGYPIISTARGYVLDHRDEVIKVFKVHHTAAETEAELNVFVDLGCEVKDVFIYHRVYGEIHASLNIRSRKDVNSFCSDISNGRSTLLMTTTSGYHYHTVVAQDHETMDMVEQALREHGFLAPLTEFEPDSVRTDNKD